MTEYEVLRLKHTKLCDRALEILCGSGELYQGEYQRICDEASVVFADMMNAKFEEQESLYGTRA